MKPWETNDNHFVSHHFPTVCVCITALLGWFGSIGALSSSIVKHGQTFFSCCPLGFLEDVCQVLKQALAEPVFKLFPEALISGWARKRREELRKSWVGFKKVHWRPAPKPNQFSKNRLQADSEEEDEARRFARVEFVCLRGPKDHECSNEACAEPYLPASLSLSGMVSGFVRLILYHLRHMGVISSNRCNPWPLFRRSFQYVLPSHYTETCFFEKMLANIS